MDSQTNNTGILVSQNGAAIEEKKVLKPCCACPETRKMRDDCMIMNGEEKCQPFIEAHKECLRSKGFNAWSRFIGNMTHHNIALEDF